MRTFLFLLLAAPAAASQAWLSAERRESLDLLADAAAAQAAAAARPAALVEERVCVVKVKLKRSDFTLDLDRALERWAINNLTAEHRTMIAGERQCSTWRKGQTLSGKFDGLNFVLTGELASYAMTVQELSLHRSHFIQERSGAARKVPQAEYERALAELARAGAATVSVPAAGMTRTTVLSKPLSEHRAASRRPLRRFFVEIEVKNTSFTLDLAKHARNMLNAHRVSFEVPRATYEQAKGVWDRRLNLGTLIINGNFSSMNGKIVRKWTESDPSYEEITTVDGLELVAPVGKVP